jgi:hypothetical protein
MPLFYVEGRLVRNGNITVEADTLEQAHEAFKEHYTGGFPEGLKLAEEEAPTVEILDSGETDDVYWTVSR